MVKPPHSEYRTMKPPSTVPGRSTADDVRLAIVVGMLAALAVGGLSLMIIGIVELLRQLDFPFYWRPPSLLPSFLPHFP
jgi:hypothetical protein